MKKAKENKLFASSFKTKKKSMQMKSRITLVLFIGLIIAIIVSKNVEDNMLNRIGVVSAIGIDKSKTGYIASVQIFNPAANSKEGAAELGSYTYSEQGRTISEAIDRIHNRLSRKIFLDSTQVVVIGETLGKSEGLIPLTNYFLRNSNLPGNIKFVIAKGVKPDKLLQIMTPVQKVSGSRLDEMLSRQRDSWGDLINITSDKIMGKLSQDKMELTIPYITIKGNLSKGISKDNIDRASPPAVLTLEGLAVFNRQRLSYWLSSRESTLYVLAHAKIYDTTLVTKCPQKNGYVTWKNVESKPLIQIQNKKGNPSFFLQIQMKGKVSDLSCQLDTSSVGAIASLEHGAEVELQQQLNQLIVKTQDKKTDVIGFGDALYRKQPDMWNRVKDKWGSVYSKVPFKTKVKMDLLDAGEILSSIK